MKRAAALAMILGILLSLCPGAQASDTDETPFRFDDVQDEQSYYFEAVYWAYGSDPQITNGMDGAHFAPDDPCTRAQVVTFLWRAAGTPETQQKTTPFADADTTRYYYRPLLWALENGIAAGMDETHFAPDAICTRGQIVTFLWRLAGKPKPKSQSNIFTDVASEKFYYDAVLWAMENSITNGTSGTCFSPDAPCTRAQIVSFLYRFDGYEIPVCNHYYYPEKTVAPKCTQKGYTVYKCIYCNLIRNDSYVNPLGHQFEEKTVAPTCTEVGYIKYTCTRCGDSYTEQNAPALGHSYKNGACTRCGQKTPSASAVYDISAAMAVGNAYAQSLGFTIDYSLNANNSSFRPSDWFGGSYLNNHGGQNRLNQLAMAGVDSAYSWLSGMGYFEDEIRGRCYIEYDSVNDNYEVWFFFG